MKKHNMKNILLIEYIRIVQGLEYFKMLGPIDQLK